MMGLYRGHWGWFSPLLLTPLAIVRIRQVWKRDGKDLNPLLGKTAQLELIFCLLLSAGLIIESIQRVGS
jgi:1,4-dihydroxy-2-naphthoate octaprenyltransferase